MKNKIDVNCQMLYTIQHEENYFFRYIRVLWYGEIQGEGDMNRKLLLMVGILSVFSMNVMATKIDGRLVDNTSSIYSQDKNLDVRLTGHTTSNLISPTDLDDTIVSEDMFSINLNRDLVDMNSATFETSLD